MLAKLFFSFLEDISGLSMLVQITKCLIFATTILIIIINSSINEILSWYKLMCTSSIEIYLVSSQTLIV